LLFLVFPPHCNQLTDYIQQLFSWFKQKECETLWLQMNGLKTV
jgi:hypothetical protein